jgi:hypothetical protein
MSKYEWERGTITVPASEWPRLRTAVIEAWNVEQERAFVEAERLYTLIGQAGLSRADEEAVRGFARQQKQGRDEDRFELALRLVLPTSFDDVSRKRHVQVKKPSRSDLKLFAVSRSCTLPLQEATIELKNEGRTVGWSVPDNNHACESARAEAVARALFSALARVKWSRGTGGVIVGNDEYNRDSDEDGGGANYVVCRFGPAEGKRRGGPTGARPSW